MSDSSDCTTFSQDERIEQYLNQVKENELRMRQLLEEERKKYFENLSRRVNEATLVPGLKIIKLNELKIKFCIIPSEMTDYVSKKVKFYIVLKYLSRYKKWVIKKDSLPLSKQKKAIYKSVYDEGKFCVTDKYVLDTIYHIHELMQNWAEQEKAFRLNKWERYKTGQLDWRYLDADDEEIFLTEAEKEQLYNRKRQILRRMLPSN